jgi:uncharacterized protein YegP (UPF0339 family)
MAKRPFPSFLIFPDGQGQWQWDFVGPMGTVIAASQISYPHPEGCARAILLLREGTPIPILMKQTPIAHEQARSQTSSATPAVVSEGVLELEPDQIVL